MNLRRRIASPEAQDHIAICHISHHLPAALRSSFSRRIKNRPKGAVSILRSFASSCFATSRRLDCAHGDLAGAAVFLGIERDLLALD